MDDSDPIAVFLAARNEALAAGEGWDAAACALATVGADGRPSVRMVLSREVDSAGFRIYTNLESRKGRDLLERPFAALAFHWDRVHCQFRVEGAVQRLPDAESDAYFAARPRESQLGAWASQQSQPIGSRDELMARLGEVERRYGGTPVPRPPHWGGVLVVPDRIERWIQGDARLHHRTAWIRQGSRWHSSTLQP